jgi:hypothetical protein
MGRSCGTPGKPRQGREGIHLVDYLIRLSIREYLARPAHLRRRIKVSSMLMPIFVGMLPLAPLLLEPMRPVAIGGLLGHLDLRNNPWGRPCHGEAANLEGSTSRGMNHARRIATIHFGEFRKK